MNNIKASVCHSQITPDISKGTNLREDETQF